MKKILFFTVLGLCILVIVNLLSSIYTLWHKQDLLTQTARQLQQEQQEHKQLQKQLSQVSTSSFVEEEARNKLFMVKQGEQEVLISQADDASRKAQTKPKDTRPYWQQWIGIFFH